jgi:hypothetical protein
LVISGRVRRIAVARLIIAIVLGLALGVGGTGLAKTLLSNAANGAPTTQSLYSGYGPYGNR